MKDLIGIGKGRRTTLLFIAISLLSLLSAPGHLFGSTALLMEEPYGKFGSMNPTGHAAVYLKAICADSPTVLRACHDGEFGAVISRYHKIDGYDWIAMPMVGYLYSVDNLADIPGSVDKEKVAALRNAYRKAHLQDLAPDGPGGTEPKGEWTQLVGSAFDVAVSETFSDVVPAGSDAGVV